MSSEDQIRWDLQHEQSQAAEEPCSFLKEILTKPYWPTIAGRALDIACGQGANAVFLAAQGLEVTAVDISSVALRRAAERASSRSVSIAWQQADLEAYRFPLEAYDLIVNINYLQRSLILPMKSALRPGGYIIFETYLIDQQTIGHPKNPDYLLGRNELLNYFRDLRVLYYREGKFIDRGTPSFRAGIFAQKEY